MSCMHIRNLDLNLLVVADALFRHKNASKAALDLGLTQSAVSHALARLRDYFKDPLFVRASKGVLPTEFARGIQADLAELLRRAELLASKKTAFDPSRAKGRITLSTTDYTEVVLLPLLLPIMRREAPGIQISIRPTQGDLPKGELEAGKVDLAIAGFYQKIPEGFFRSKLFTDSFRVAACSKNTRFGSKLSIDDYYSAGHALITLRGDFRDDLTRKVRNKKQERQIVYGSYSFTGLAWVLQSSDLLLTAPSLLLSRYREYFPLRIWEGPIELGKIEIQMIWHAQTHDDPLRQWFRTKLKSVCQKLPSS